MKTMAFLSLLVGILGVCDMAHAEGGTCPDGYYPANSPGVMGCAPIPGYNQQQQRPAQLPPPQWESRWGAVAADVPGGAVGASTDMPSRQAAEQGAMADCEAQGSRNCVIETWYSNGCAAMVISDETHTTNNAATLDEAIQKGMRMCSQVAANCRVYYSACSLPVRIR
jgi:Domain of unknown function (DUF4189)